MTSNPAAMDGLSVIGVWQSITPVSWRFLPYVWLAFANAGKAPLFIQVDGGAFGRHLLSDVESPAFFACHLAVYRL